MGDIIQKLKISIDELRAIQIAVLHPDRGCAFYVDHVYARLTKDELDLMAPVFVTMINNRLAFLAKHNIPWHDMTDALLDWLALRGDL